MTTQQTEQVDNLRAEIQCKRACENAARQAGNYRIAHQFADQAEAREDALIALLRTADVKH